MVDNPARRPTRYKATRRWLHMDIRGKMTRNMGVAVIATIAVAACLLFAYLTVQDPGDGPQPRTVEEVGDYVEYGLWYGDDEYSYIRITLICIEDGFGEYMVERNEVYTGTVNEELGFIAKMTVMDASWNEPIRQEHLCTIGGDISCDVYEEDAGTYLVSDGLILKGVTDDGTYIVFSTSMADGSAPETVSSRSGIMPYDYIAMQYEKDGTTYTMIDVIDSVDVDTVDITVITYIRNADVTDKIESKEEYGLEEYIGFYFIPDEDKADWTPEGRTVCLPLAFGNVMCETYTYNGVRMWAGVDDGFVYRMDYGDMTMTLIGTSLTYGQAFEFDRSPANDITDGFSDTRSTILIETDSNGVHGFECNTTIHQVDGMEDGMADVTVTDLPWMDETALTMDAEDLSSKTDFTELGRIYGVSVSNTVFGTKLTIVAYDDDGDAWFSEMVDVFSDIRYCYFDGERADVTMWYLTDSDEVHSDRTCHELLPGDAFMYRCEDSNGDVFEELYCVYYDNGMHYVATDSDGFILIGSLDSDSRYMGTETVTTAFGELECKVYEVPGNYDIVRKVYMADGFVCPVYFEYTYNGYSQKGELTYVSTM